MTLLATEFWNAIKRTMDDSLNAEERSDLMRNIGVVLSHGFVALERWRRVHDQQGGGGELVFSTTFVLMPSKLSRSTFSRVLRTTG